MELIFTVLKISSQIFLLKSLKRYNINKKVHLNELNCIQIGHDPLQCLEKSNTNVLIKVCVNIVGNMALCRSELIGIEH